MSASFETDSESLPLYEVIYRVLRQHIADESLPRGLVVGEEAVARAFHSSRVPARAALIRLRDEGLLHNLGRRGLMVRGGARVQPLRLDLIAAGLKPPEPASFRPMKRRAKIYAEVEHVVALCSFFGRFRLNESVLAEHYGVSRTIAHEVVAQLDRVGLIEQDQNQRWYVGPLTAERMREHFELRWLLEPLALDQAFSRLDQADLLTKRERIKSAMSGQRTPVKLEKLERDLHVDTVLRCSNSRLREAIIRSQLPLFAAHDTFQQLLNADQVDMMLMEHLAIFEHLIADERQKARQVLERHLKRSVDSNVRRLKSLGPLPVSRRFGFLVPAG
jgi:DNA-binding GntR family transcriptional regulator